MSLSVSMTSQTPAGNTNFNFLSSFEANCTLLCFFFHNEISNNESFRACFPFVYMIE